MQAFQPSAALFSLAVPLGIISSTSRVEGLTVKGRMSTPFFAIEMMPFCLLADHDSDGVGVLGDAEAGARVPMSLPKSRLLEKGQHTACGLDAAILDDGCAVVEGVPS